MQNFVFSQYLVNGILLIRVRTAVEPAVTSLPFAQISSIEAVHSMSTS